MLDLRGVIWEDKETGQLVRIRKVADEEVRFVDLKTLTFLELPIDLFCQIYTAVGEHVDLCS